jgi:hypothetical protein
VTSPPSPTTSGVLAPLDDLGLVVEGIEHVGEGSGGRRGEPRHRDRAPSRGRQASAGSWSTRARPLEIVCGAWNFDVGDRVPLAPVGAVLPGGIEIAAARCGGRLQRDAVLGQGARLSDDGAGLLVLGDEDAGPGGRPSPRRSASRPTRSSTSRSRATGPTPGAWPASPATWRPGSGCPSPCPDRPPGRRRAAGRWGLGDASVEVDDDLCPRLTVSVLSRRRRRAVAALDRPAAAAGRHAADQQRRRRLELRDARARASPPTPTTSTLVAGRG